MKALSLTQPWATLIAIGAKKIETRSWATKHRGLIAIHAAKGLGPVGGVEGFKYQCATEPFYSVLQSHADTQQWKDLKDLVERPLVPLGAIVAVANLAACKSTSPFGLLANWVDDLTPQERAFGDYSKGRFGWVLEDVRPLQTPIPCRGALSLWDVPADVEQAIKEQLKLAA